MKNYSKIIERECSTITNTLAAVHQDMIVQQQSKIIYFCFYRSYSIDLGRQTDNYISEDSTNLS